MVIMRAYFKSVVQKVKRFFSGPREKKWRPIPHIGLSAEARSILADRRMARKILKAINDQRIKFKNGEIIHIPGTDISVGIIGFDISDQHQSHSSPHFRKNN